MQHQRMNETASPTASVEEAERPTEFHEAKQPTGKVKSDEAEQAAEMVKSDEAEQSAEMVKSDEAEQSAEMVQSDDASSGRNGEGSPAKSDDMSDMQDPDHLITDEMRKEEEKLHKKTIREEQEEKRKAIKELATKELREQRYKRLQFLLTKSSLYTNYLVQRMEAQAAEEKAKEERKIKKEQNAAAKEQVKEEMEGPRAQTDDSEATPTVNGDAANSNSQSSEDVTDEPKKTKERPRRAASSSQESQGATGAPKRGRKRKALNAVDNYKLTDFLPSLISQKKKQKLDEEAVQKEAEKVKETNKLENGKDDGQKDNEQNGSKENGKQDVDNSSKDGDGSSKDSDSEQSLEKPYYFTGGSLRQYQKEGVKWLTLLYENGINGILADEMGLGKTIQCIAAIAFLIKRAVTGPFLVVGPLSTVPNWVAEFKKFAPKIPVILYHGTKDERTQLRVKLRKKHRVDEEVSMFPVVVTSYEISMIDRAYLMNNKWKYIIVDEGHRIKNFQCKLIRELKMYKSVHRLLLTGTPLQNNLSELWSLLNFLLPDIFDDLSGFEAWFDVDALRSDEVDKQIVAEEQKKNVLSMLHQILTPFMLRRLKSDVELLVPPKREVLVYAPLSQKQAELYRMCVDKTIKKWVVAKKAVVTDKTVDLEKTGRGVRRASSRKVNYALMLESEEDVERNKREDEKQKQKNQKYNRKQEKNKGEDEENKGEDEKNMEEEEREEEIASDDEDEVDDWIKAVSDMNEENNNRTMEQDILPEKSWRRLKIQNTLMLLKKACNHPYLIEYPYIEDTELLRIDEDVIRESGKMMLLDKMLPKLKEQGSKILIFTQMVMILDLLADFCDMRGYKFGRLDGTMKLEDRQDQIEKFMKDPEVFVFIVSTRAGGLGINLTAADTVIIFDSDWNPQCDLQAQDRAHRIGQTKPVVVYRMVAGNTIDQRIVERARAKRKLEKMVIHKGRFKKGWNSYSGKLEVIKPEELLELLKSSDYHEVVRGEENEVISDADLDKLLDKSDLYAQWEEQKRVQAQGKTSVSPRKQAPVEIKTEHVEGVKGVFKVVDTSSVSSSLLERVGASPAKS